MIIGRQLFRAQNVRLLFCEICSRATVRPFEGRSVAALLLGLAEVLFFGTGLTAQSPPPEWHSTFELQSDRNVQGGLQAAWARAQLEDAQATLEAARAAKDLGAEADTLNEIAGLYFTMSEFQKALAYLDLALPTYRKVGNRAGEARVLQNVGAVYSSLGQTQKALNSFNQSLLIYGQLDASTDEADTLKAIGELYSVLGEKQNELESLNQLVLVCRQLDDDSTEAETLNDIGSVYLSLDEKEKALESFNQALALYDKYDDYASQAKNLDEIGIIYWTLGELEKALESLNKALLLNRQVGNRVDEADTLGDISLVYSSLGDNHKALELLNQILLVFREEADALDESTTLGNIGMVYFRLGDNQKALEYYNQVLQIARKTHRYACEACALTNIGEVYLSLGEKQKALEYLNQASRTWRPWGDQSGKPTALIDLGRLYSSLGERQKALDSYNRAMPLVKVIGEPLTEALILYNLMQLQKNQQPSLAIFLGKQAINIVQQVRGGMRGLDMKLRKSFLSSNSSYYHDLAGLLIDQGRLPEAQRVLDTMKEQEYSDFVSGKWVKTLSPLSLTSAEEQAEKDYQQLTAQLVSLRKQWAQLKDVTSRTPEQEKQYQQLSVALSQASQDLNSYYSRLYVLFGKNSNINERLADVKGNATALRQQIAGLPHTVALYTFIAKDHYRVIVITGTTSVAREYPIGERELNRKIAAFAMTLRHPSQDCRPPAQELYKMLVGPVKSDLDRAEAQTLVWFLDGMLRYIPMSALYDGKQYLVEKYKSVTITPASIPHLTDKPNVENLTAVAMGISRQYEPLLEALPAVVSELDDIVRDPQSKDSHGVLPGTILLNGQFTEKGMEDHLGDRHPVVHIATHFVFLAGDDSSFLLLAGKDNEDRNGYHLTVAAFRDDQKLTFRDTDLLTLSACETGMEGNAGNGREIDGLGMMAHLKGAKSVIASLWPVNDSSTADMMGDFYRRWADGRGKVEKVEALRQAQLDLLLGKIKPDPDATNANAPTSFAHPYYWAPFVLMGNWR